jgi:hypothetical protein
MEIALLLSLIGVLGGVWIFLYHAILDLTVSAPADSTLFFLGVAHWTVLAYFALALYVFYERGVSVVTKRPAPERAHKAELILLETWPLTLISLAVGFVISKLGESDFWLKVPVIILAASGLIPVLYRRYRRNRNESPKRLSAGTMVFVLACIGLLSVPYTMFMSVVLADVQITTDKQFYSASDTILISVRAAGFIARPFVKQTRFGVFSNAENRDATFAITPDQRANQDLIMVDYSPQMTFWTRTAYHMVNVVKMDN